MADPLPRGVVIRLSVKHADLMDALARDTLSALRALKADASLAPGADPDVDFVVLLVEPGARLPHDLPDLKDRAACAIGLADDAAEGRVAVTAARKRLRASFATLGARELVLLPSQLGVIGIESDTLRERLHILLQTLVLDADRLRLKREGWEEPDARPSE